MTTCLQQTIRVHHVHASLGSVVMVIGCGVVVVIGNRRVQVLIGKRRRRRGRRMVRRRMAAVIGRSISVIQ